MYHAFCCVQHANAPPQIDTTNYSFLGLLVLQTVYIIILLKLLLSLRLSGREKFIYLKLHLDGEVTLGLITSKTMLFVKLMIDKNTHK